MGKTTEGAARSDTLVLFGVTGDLAHKMIFTALYTMAKRGAVKVPMISVAFSKWSRAHRRTDQFDPSVLFGVVEAGHAE